MSSENAEAETVEAPAPHAEAEASVEAAAPPMPPAQSETAAGETKENKAKSSHPVKTVNSKPGASTAQVGTATKGKRKPNSKNNAKSGKPASKSTAPRKRTTMVAALQAENARLRKELLKAKDTIAKLKRGERVMSYNSRSKKIVARGTKKIGRVSNRLYNPKHEQERNTKRANAKKQSELGQCSFKPTRVAKHIQRTELGTLAFSRLYLDADRLAKKKADKAAENQEAKVSRFSFRPEVSEKSRKMQASVSRKERMFRLSIPKPHAAPNTPSMQKEDLIECTFKPRINPDSMPTSDAPLHQRLYRAGLDAKEKMQKLREEKSNREYEEAMGACTFHPDIGESGSNAVVKSGEEMSQVINRLAVTDVEQRIDNQNARVKENTLEMSFAPEINPVSADMANSRNGDITERLYTVKMGVENAPIDENCTFTPEITQMAFEVDRSELPVHERLSLHRSPSQREAFADMNEYDGYNEEEEEEYEEEDGEEEVEEYEEGEEGEEEEDEDDEEDITF